MTNSTIFNEAIEAIKKGDNDRARDLLMRLLRTEKRNPEYWLWMSSVVTSSKERKYCLQNVLQLDASNEVAKRGLILLGYLPASDVEPVPPPHRDWEAVFDDQAEELKGFRKIMANPVLRILFFIGAGCIVIGLILGGIYGTRGIFKPKLTITPVAWTPTPTETLTLTPKFRTPTPTPFFTPTPEPLWMLLEATYTPIPLYVNTPHPRLEAYRLAIRAFERGDYDSMVNFLEQTLQGEMDAPDVSYYLGEGYRLQEDYENALQYYDDALAIDPRFAPAYYSRSLVKVMLNPRFDILPDLNRAIDFDPQFVDAYLMRAIYQSDKKDYDAALADLDIAVRIMPTNPLLHLEMAKNFMAIGENDLALESSEQAYQLDITHLPTYLILAQAYLEVDLAEKALEKLEVYGLYSPNDPYYLALLGGAKYEIGDEYDVALAVLERAQSIDDELAIAHYYHGLLSLRLDDTNQAVNDLYIARTIEPENFMFNIWFGIALYFDGRNEDAYRQIDASESLIRMDDELGIFYYYRGKVGLELSQYDTVKDAWRALIELPVDAVPQDWLDEAEEYFRPPTETPTPSNTPTQTLTFTPTNTARAVMIPTATNRPTTTPTAETTPSATP